MDRIPQEILDRIVSYITLQPGNDTSFRLSPFSTLSLDWQRAIEQQTFRYLHVTGDDLGNLGDIVVNQRRVYLRHLRLQVNFPDYDDELSNKYETDDERCANNALAMTSLKRLLAVLSTWGPDSGSELSLQLSFRSPGDRKKSLRWGGILEKRYEYSFVTLNGVDECAEAPCVTRFYAECDYRARRIEPRSLYNLMSRFPGAKSAGWYTVEPGVFTLLRQELHDRFIMAVESGSHCMPPILDVEIEGPEYDYDHNLPNLITPYTYDRFSSAFRQLSLGLTNFTFKGIADHSLLWPSPGQSLEPRWQNLVYLEVQLSLQSPSGKWYFRNADSQVGDVPRPPEAPVYRPPGYYDTKDEIEAAIAYERAFEKPDSDSGYPCPAPRDQPNEELMVPLFTAFARALGAMPSLKLAHIEFPNQDLDITFFLSYALPGRVTTYESYLREEERPLPTTPRLLAHTWDWRMDEDLEGMFRRAGAAVHGVETAVRYLPPTPGCPL
ncbi:uncharacterized protein DNG_09789 [Cephalotrichum gorgonifer]|uniref:F-box domain-containing protein n=1 Tax=Cephalotrichum gorgonifer TaxID=2041049 RepID=A0AAE8SZN7_9PEZI|nr:uncharacterized protein DNG_09789 [Cephalotrichum gorgonifer]